VLHRIQMLGRHGGRQAELPGGRGEASGSSCTGEHLHSRKAVEHCDFSLWLKTESTNMHVIA
jgi:hypothetical protein